MSDAIDSLFARLAAAGIQLRVEPGERLRYRAPKGALTPELAAEIKAAREALIARLQTADDDAIPRLPTAPHYALSQAQWRLWVLMQMDQGSTAYNVPLHLEFHGPLDAERVAEVFTALVDRHEALRTRFILVDGEPRQAVRPPAPVDLIRHVAASLDEARNLARAQTGAPFDLDRDPLLRLGLVRLAPDHHVLLLTLHHIIADGTSFGILLREFGQAYNDLGRGDSPVFEPLPLQYRDYAAWQNARLHDPAMAAQGAYWREQLHAPLPVLELPLDRPRPPVQTHAGREHTFVLDAATTARLTSFCQRHGATPFMGLLTLVKVLLHHYTGQTDLIVGSPIAGRTHPALQDQVGFYLNTLALRTTIDPAASLAAQLRSVRGTVTAAFDHQDYPFDFLVNELGLARDLSRTPLFDVMVILQNQDESGSPMPGLEVRSFLDPSNSSKLDLTFYFKLRGDTLHGAIEYNPDLFDTDRVERMSEHLATLTAALEDAEHLTVANAPLLTDREVRQVTLAFNPVPTPREPRTTLHLIADTVANHPDRIALCHHTTTLTYAALWSKSRDLTAALIDLGVQPGDRVGVCLERTPWLIVALLAVWRTGAAYVPLDPGFPSDRLIFVLEDVVARALIATPATAAPLAASGIPVLPPEATGTATLSETTVEPKDLAYILHTSGSTGKPKGVAIPHGGLTNFLRSMQHEPGLSPDDRLLALTTVSFDIAGLELWLPLITGATIVLADRSTAVDGHQILDTLQRERITFLQATPATWRLLLDAGWQPGQTPNLALACGGEALPGALARELLPRGRALWNLYGPTETTVWSTAHRVTDDDATASIVTIGRPVANTHCFVLSAAGQPAPIGVAGELHIGGEGLAIGYWRRDDLTAERFVPAPPTLRNGAGHRLYRTGDLVRWRADGTLEFFGRIDHQVKLRGYRIELGEIEAVLAGHPTMRVAAVVLHNEELVAYVEPEPNATATVDTWREHLRRHLPEYMVPTRWTVLDTLPLTANGKIDRRALPAPQGIGPASAANVRVAPRTPLERDLAAIWSEILERPEPGAFDSFFELGGHSLKAARVVARIRRDLHLPATIADLFAHPVLADLAARLTVGESTVPETARAADHRSPRVAVAQRRLWLLEQMRPGTTAYHMADTWWIDGPLDVQRLQGALAKVIQHHDSLRTGFISTDDDEAVAATVAAHVEPRFEFHDASTAPDPSAAALHLASRSTAEPFDFARPPLLRVLVVRVAPEHHLVHWVMHHIISDAWSVTVLLRDLATAYDSGTSNFPATTPYQHFAHHQHALLASAMGGVQAEFWRKQLDGDLAPLDLPADKVRPGLMGTSGHLQAISFAPATWSRLQALARVHHATDFMTLVALVSGLMHRITGQSDIRLGVPVAGREEAAWENTVGFFINTMVLRVRPTADLSADDLITQIRDTAVQGFAHQAYPFDQLVDDLKPERDLSRNPLFDVSVQHRPHETSPPALGGLSITRERPVEVPLKCDLSFDFGEEDGTLVCGLTYNPDLFAADRIARLAGHLQTLADAMGRCPATSLAELALLPAAELRDVTETFARIPPLPGEPSSLSAAFETAVTRDPQAPAFVSPVLTLNYADLDARIDALAVVLCDHGVQPGEVVGVLTGRDVALPVALFATLRLGAVYLPLDPALPDARLAFLARDAALRHVLCTTTLAHRCPGGVTAIPIQDTTPLPVSATLPAPPDPAAPAALIYTSGSTGQPKGVLVSHRAYANTIGNIIETLRLGPHTRILQFANPSFDASLFELLGALLSGAALVQVDEAHRIDPAALISALTSLGVTHAVLPPSFVRAFEQAPLPLQVLLTAGEAAVAEDAHHYAQSLRFVNAYGPTEAAICSTMEFVNPRETFAPHLGVPIGRPLAGTDLYLLDARQRPVPIGVDGEIWVGGLGLAEGYWQQPKLTATAFGRHPAVPNQRLYRTGDIGRWLPDGRVAFLGRRDGQIKLRGHRIETGEIEHTLRAHPDIADALVVLRRDPPDRPQLTAYILAAGPRPDLATLRPYLASRLPESMIPEAFVALESWPLTPAGKIDSRALPSPDPLAAAAEYVAPVDDVERLLAGIFAEVLERPRVGRLDRFFLIGGNSLLALKVVSRVRQALRVDLPVPEFFAHAAVADLGKALRSDESSRTRLNQLASARARLAAMTPEQKRALLARRPVTSPQS